MSKPRTHAIVSLLSHSPFTNPRLLPQKSLSSLSKFKPCKSLIILYLPAENQKKLITGFHQRYNVLPKAIDLEGNTKRVGFYQRIIIYHYSKKILTAGIHDSVTQFNIHAFSKNDFFNRTAKIFFQDDNHMHNVPIGKLGYKWAVQLERKAVYKTPAMGWTYNNDSQSKRTVYFKEMDDAVFYCREMGFGYEVQYPHFRYYQKKSYADNFKWKGNPKNEEDF